MAVPEEVLIGVRNRLASTEAGLRSNQMKEQTLLDQLVKTHEAIKHGKQQFAELHSWLAKQTGFDDTEV